MRSQLAKAVDTKHDGHPVAPLLISIAEAAKVLSIGRTTLYGLISAGRITPVRLGGRTLVPLPNCSGSSPLSTRRNPSRPPPP
jgi:excisionase family DNA binding protein